ncbi:MAG: N-6 DNA methylase, partial [Planctomycetia bacterium]|nr:N-6 DNA methylase [Planctomycetia bacterium]
QRSKKAGEAEFYNVSGIKHKEGDMQDFITKLVQMGTDYERTLKRSSRKHTGTFYTPYDLASRAVRIALEPLLENCRTQEDFFHLRICDPSMGAGIFLLEACRQISENLTLKTGMPLSSAKKLVSQRCLWGVDSDPEAVKIAKRILSYFIMGEEVDHDFSRVFSEKNINQLTPHFICADSLKNWRDPEIFSSSGFHVVMGNPPFLGGRKIRRMLGDEYFRFLTEDFVPGASGNADLCAFFLRLAGKLLRPGGVCGFITPHSISQGDSRKTGLDFLIHSQGATIFHAENHLKWEGDAAIHVALIHLQFPLQNTEGSETPVKKYFPVIKHAPFLLNGVQVPYISSALHTQKIPQVLPVFKDQKNLCFQGHVLAGKGFLLSRQTGERLLAENPKNREVIFPYFTGEELFHSSCLQVKRMVIHFHDWPREKAEEFPEVFKILEEKVFPVRKKVRRKRHREMWWKFGDTRPVMTKILKENAFHRVMVQTRHCKHFTPIFVNTGFPHNSIFSESTVIFPSDSFLFYALLNSSLHEIWARRTSSSLGKELRYTPTEAFYTFPLPWNAKDLCSDDHFPSDSLAKHLRQLGKMLHEHRLKGQKEQNLSVSEIYDLFHDPDVTEKYFLELRELHFQINFILAQAYAKLKNVPEILEIFGNRHDLTFFNTPRGIRWAVSPENENRLIQIFIAKIRFWK